jgi:hypothetical protein
MSPTHIQITMPGALTFDGVQQVLIHLGIVSFPDTNPSMSCCLPL